MENHEPGTQNDKMCAEPQLETPQIPNNLFGPSAKIWDIFENSSHHKSIVHEHVQDSIKVKEYLVKTLVH